MLVNDKHLTTIWYEKKTDKVKIIDQRRIPFELKINCPHLLYTFIFASG